MNRETKKVKGYCALCSCWCPIVSYVNEGVFTEVKPDIEHPLAIGLCPKGFAGSELVYSKQRLQYPMKRTKPKGESDPGWERISWDEALDIIATRLNEIKAKYGPESVAFARAGTAGSPIGEIAQWIYRLANSFGTPNSIGTTHICQWHRDNCSAYTFGNIGGMGAAGSAEFERSACILIWGNNVHDTRNSLVPPITRGLSQGAKLIVIDPRKTQIASMADLWLQIQPGTDGALALSFINIILKENLFDYDFLRDWTTAPFLVRSDTGNFLKANHLADDGAPSSYLIMDSTSDEPKIYIPGSKMSIEPVIDGVFSIRTTVGKEIECKTVLRLLRESVSEYTASRTEKLTGVPQDKITSAARMFATIKPSCWYSWNGIEQNVNASQTNRAICILYALTGNYDKPGGNVVLRRFAGNPVAGHELLGHEVRGKRLGSAKRPLGPGGLSFQMTQGYEVYRAILTGKPYPIKAMLGFGGNLISSNAPSLLGREAISQLDFHAQSELFMTPTAEMADIVLPAASSFESWHVGVNTSLGGKACIQLRPAVVSPQHESRPDMEIIFELAKRLGFGDKFWSGNIEAAFDYHLAPLNITVEQLKKNLGAIVLDWPVEYQKYKRKDHSSNSSGFPTPSKRVEIYSSIFMEHGYPPLPNWKEPAFPKESGRTGKNTLVLTGSKLMEYCHSQHRALPSLRKGVPHPFVEINSQKALELGLKDGDWVVVETATGSITLQVKPTDGIPYNVACAQHGWWQACPELNLPGYDPYSTDGANVNLLYGDEEIDPVSGSLPIKGHPCNVRKVIE